MTAATTADGAAEQSPARADGGSVGPDLGGQRQSSGNKQQQRAPGITQRTMRPECTGPTARRLASVRKVPTAARDLRRGHQAHHRLLC